MDVLVYSHKLQLQNKKILDKCLISDYLNMQVFIKIGFMLQVMLLIICNPKLKIYENFWTSIPRNKQNILLPCFWISLLYILLISFIQNCQSQAEAYSEPYQIFKMIFLAKIIDIFRGLFTMESNIWGGAF